MPSINFLSIFMDVLKSFDNLMTVWCLVVNTYWKYFKCFYFYGKCKFSIILMYIVKPQKCFPGFLTAFLYNIDIRRLDCNCSSCPQFNNSFDHNHFNTVRVT